MTLGLQGAQPISGGYKIPLDSPAGLTARYLVIAVDPEVLTVMIGDASAADLRVGATFLERKFGTDSRLRSRMRMGPRLSARKSQRASVFVGALVAINQWREQEGLSTV